MTRGPFDIQRNADPAGVIADVIKSDRDDIYASIVSRRHEVSGEEPMKNGELILEAFRLAHALRHSNRDPAEVIAQAAAIVDEAESEDEEETPAEVIDPAPRPQQVDEAFATKPEGEQAMAVASTDDEKVFIYFKEPMLSIALSDEEAKNFAGQILNHARGQVG